MMVCVTTSVTLLDSVLRKAGPKTIAEYRQTPRSQNLIILDGGSTSAKNILFIAWELEVNSLNTQKAEQVTKEIIYRINRILFL